MVDFKMQHIEGCWGMKLREVYVGAKTLEDM